MVDIGTLGGTDSNGVAISPVGHGVGVSGLAGDEVSHAYLWTQESGMIDLGTLGGNFSGATAVNVRGHVVGNSTTDPSDLVRHAVLWEINPAND
jgi:probable HAF family extracellular repeat protein